MTSGHRERLAVVLSPDGWRQPEVLALRADFPLVPHLNLRPLGFPRSLCLYDGPFDEVLLISWTAPAFIERIREWLAATARGQLHADDQPLEPLLFDPMEDLVIPEDLCRGDSGDVPRWLSVRLVPRGFGLFTVIARPMDATNSTEEPACVAFVASCPPQAHGIIRHTPYTLEDLHSLITVSGLNLLDTLRGQLKSWLLGAAEELQGVLRAHLILVIRLPKTREPGGEVEAIEVRAFVARTNH